MSKEEMKLALEALAVKFSKGWHEGIKIDASDIMLLNDAAQALAEQPAQCAPAEDGVCEALDCSNHKPAQQEPIDTLIAAWQALEETSDRVPDEGNVEGRMHISVIRSAWEQMGSLVSDLWDERGCK